MTAAFDPIPAATLIVMRDVPAGPPELLIVERAADLAFAGGALVFPGGRIDPADRLLATRIGAEGEDAAARIAAIRETIEEAGVAIGLDLAPEALETVRTGLHDGQPLSALIDQAPRLDLLVPFAHWIPREVARRRFDTRFYLARAPEQAPEARSDAGETVRLFWASAAEVLAQADAGRASLIFPTRRNLERLARFASHAEAVADAHAHPIDVITPWIEQREDVDHLCIPEGLGYPITAEPLHRVRRG